MFSDSDFLLKLFDTFIRQIGRALMLPINSFLHSFHSRTSSDSIGRKASKEVTDRIKDITKRL